MHTKQKSREQNRFTPGGAKVINYRFKKNLIKLFSKKKHGKDRVQ